MTPRALARLTVALGGLVSAVLSAAGLGYFLSPLLRRREDNWVDAGKAGDFKPGQPKLVEFTERRRDAWVVTESRASAWVVKGEGEAFTAFDPRCTHLGCPYRWDVKSDRFVCPCHTAAFGLDGKVLGGPPPRPLDRYEAKVAEERLQILPKPAGEGS